MNKAGKHTTTAPTDVRISVTNFGPIASGTVDLRPLTVFVGPSNAGKTYFAILIYALHRILGGFLGLPVTYGRRYLFVQGIQPEKTAVDAEVQEKELQDVIEKLETEGRPFKFSDLPGSVRDVTQAVLKDPKLLGEELRSELERCFDLESVSDLVRLSGQRNGMTMSLDISEEDRRLWHFRMGISESVISTDGQIEDMVLLPEGWSTSKLKPDELFSQFRMLIREEREIDSQRRYWHLFEELLELLLHMNAAPGTRGETHYLPAARSGIMQGHRVIASSLVARSTRAGLVRFPELPTFSGVMADFMQRLILYEEHRGSDRPMNALADALEREALAGRIRTSRPPSGGYPEFVYRPQETKKDIRLTRASSMVSELAPIVLFLRGAVRYGDMLIIEEPEAHLHPAAQTQMAVVLARMVRAGVRVLVTTHSDWLLKEIGNLMREGELELQEKTDEPASEESFPSALRPSEVGIWLFRQDETSAGSTVEEIPFDRSEGVEPQDYENVAEALYNRSADLQNRFEETARDMEREHE